MMNFSQYNESVRDMMTPKSIEDIKKKLDNPDDLLELFVFGCEKKQGFIIKYALDNGLDIHIEDDAPLRMASRFGCKNTVKYLLEKGANVHAGGDDALMWAYELEDGDDIVDLLYKYGAMIPDINESLKDKMTPISPKDVIRNFNKIDGLDFIKIIEANLDESFTDEELINKIKTFSEMDLTMNFSHSIGYNKVRLVDLFLRAGADIHYNKDWPIYYAAKEGYTEILKLLLDKGVDPNADNGTSIYAALTNKEFQCLDMLIDAGANFDKFVDDPKYSKYIEYYNDYKKVNEGVRDLMTPKSEEEIMKRFNKFHPIDMVAKGVNNGVLSLVKKGVEILTDQSEGNVGEMSEILQNNLRNFYFTKAVERRYVEIVEYLLEVGFEPSENNMTWVCTNGSIEMIKLLIKYGSIVDDKLINHVTKYRSENIEEVLALLQKHNKDRVINKIKKKRWF